MKLAYNTSINPIRLRLSGYFSRYMQKIIYINTIIDLCRRVLATLVAVLGVFLCSSQSHAFESELIPIELNSIIANKTTSIALHKEPLKKSPIVRNFGVKKDEAINFDQSRTRTTISGKAIAKKNIYFEGKSFGDISYLSAKQYDEALPAGEINLQKYLFKKGDIIEELHRAPEGTSILRWQKKVLWIDGCISSCRTEGFKYITMPDYEWWIRVTKNGKPQGWLLIEEKTPVDLN